MMTWRLRSIVLGLAAVISVLVGALLAVALTGTGDAERELERIAAEPRDDAIVAVVNGEPIKRRWLDMGAAASLAGAADARGRPLAVLSREQILDRNIETILLAQAATRGGIEVSEEEITRSIDSGFVAPLAQENVPEEVKRLMRASLAAAGLTTETVVDDPDVRTAMRRFLLVTRYAHETGKTQAELLVGAREGAVIEVFRDVLEEGR